MRTDAERHDNLLAELARLRQVVPEITGCLVAGTDGLLIADDTHAVLAEGVAALAAACLGISQRIADCAGHQQFEEVLIRSAGGHVAMYLVGNGAVLLVSTGAGTNIGRLHHEARRATRVVSEVMAAATATFAKTLPDRAAR